jgi:hypothetical protein
MMKKWSALSILSLLTLPVWASPSMQRVTSETIVSSTAPESCIKTLDRAAGFQLPAAKTLCPTVALSGSLAFAEVGIGLTQGSNLVIQNTGTGPLVVSSIRYPAGFSGDWSGSIAEGQSHTIVVSFSPSQAKKYGGLLTVNSNAHQGVNTFRVSGKGVVLQPMQRAEQNWPRKPLQPIAP